MLIKNLGLEVDRSCDFERAYNLVLSQSLRHSSTRAATWRRKKGICKEGREKELGWEGRRHWSSAHVTNAKEEVRSALGVRGWLLRKKERQRNGEKKRQSVGLEDRHNCISLSLSFYHLLTNPYPASHSLTHSFFVVFSCFLALIIVVPWSDICQCRQLLKTTLEGHLELAELVNSR